MESLGGKAGVIWLVSLEEEGSRTQIKEQDDHRRTQWKGSLLHGKERGLKRN